MPAWSPMFLGATALKFFLDADTIAQADNTAVATWTGKINSKDAANATGAEQPTLQTNEINGHSIVRFDGTDDDLTITTHGLNKPCTIATVFKFTGAVATVRVFSSTNMMLTRSGSTNTTVLMSGGSSVQYGTAADTAYHIHVLQFAGAGNSTGSFDGTATSTAAGTGAPSANLVIGGSGTSVWTAMDMACILGVNGLVSSENIARLEGYLAHRYGLAANLPGGHVYKSAAPIITQSGGSGVY